MSFICLLILLNNYLILSKAIPTYYHSNCTNGYIIYNGTWDENIQPGYQNLSMKFHSRYEDYCAIKDFLIYSNDHKLHPVHKNDSINIAETKWRLKEIEHKFWLLLGTSVDHRLVSTRPKPGITSNRYDVCQLFGNKHQEIKFKTRINNITHHVDLIFCTIPIYKLTIGYIFTGPLSSDNKTFSNNHTYTSKLDTYQAIHRALNNHGMKPDIISLSGIEWDLLLFKHLLNSSYYYQVVNRNINIIKKIWPNSLLSLRTFYDSIDRYGRIYNKITYDDYQIYNNVFLNITNESLQINNPYQEILLMDMQQIMRYNGSYSSGWTEDGLHPSGWVILQYLNIALHQINDLILKCKLYQSGNNAFQLDY